MLKGRHSWRFGVRLRAQTDDSVSPQNFNGTFHVWRRRAGARAGCAEPARAGRQRPTAVGARHLDRTLPADAALPATGRYAGADPRARRRRHAVHDQYRHGRTCGAPDGRGNLRGRRVARAAELHAQPRPALRDADEYPRLARSCAAPRVCLGARRRRPEARENRAARRLRHLLRPFRARQYAGRAALQRPRATATRGAESRLLSQRAGARHAAGFSSRHR